MLHCVERIEELLADPDLLSGQVRVNAGQNAHEGIGFSEAPRGTLFHHYEVDDDGLIVRANLLIATAQNNLAINKSVEQAARRFVDNGALTEGMLNRVEAAVRCYDPCLSCSTHAVGQMPLVLELYDSGGRLVDRMQRRR
jgi:NAD-reducing hydrogenase large subunit